MFPAPSVIHYTRSVRASSEVFRQHNPSCYSLFRGYLSRAETFSVAPLRSYQSLWGIPQAVVVTTFHSTLANLYILSSRDCLP
ncbi:hypothetical protein PISMIDRAFT_507942 [Pisolithus microcarpus 441]|uniref:Uncharacterized protein n=1 Tax=Pisolithus microcarpus 441 TaxID=765257 RepID=A0A0C9YTS9_9AGAM|nr:hypothetical protein PISMIDRAFT_507942 [Pisolithus microcarpus 441]